MSLSGMQLRAGLYEYDRPHALSSSDAESNGAHGGLLLDSSLPVRFSILALLCPAAALLCAGKLPRDWCHACRSGVMAERT